MKPEPHLTLQSRSESFINFSTLAILSLIPSSAVSLQEQGTHPTNSWPQLHNLSFSPGCLPALCWHLAISFL